MVAQTNAAYEALRQFCTADRAAAEKMVGPGVDPKAAEQALLLLCAELRRERGVERALELTGNRIRQVWPKPGPQQQAALVILLTARGTARKFMPVPFDGESLLALQP